MPHDRGHVLADVEKGSAEHVERAIAAARDAHAEWSATPWHERVAVFLRAAELAAGPWRQTLNAVTMLNQSKTAHQAEIDAVCETCDFFRFNAEFLVRIYEEQPISSPGVWNRLEYRPLEGFVLRREPVQLHHDRHQPDHLAGADGKHGRLEAGLDRGAVGPLRARPARGSGPAAGRDQPRLRLGCRDRRRRAPQPRARRHPLHRLDTRLPEHVADRRREHRELPRLPATRRRDRRQGLHPRPPVRRPRCGRDGDRPRLVRVPGTEVLGLVAALHPVEPLAAGARPVADGRLLDRDGRRARLHQLHGRRDRRQLVQDPGRRDRRGQGGGRRDRRRRRHRRLEGLVRRAHRDQDGRPPVPAHARRALRPRRHDLRLRREGLGRHAAPRRRDRPVRPHGRGVRERPLRDRRRRSGSCATRPATSTSTTSRPAPSSASSRSAARAPPARTTRPDRCGT